MAEEKVIEMRDITKKFGDFVANDHINLDVRRGEIHALLGENGAGKSTLMNILSGLLQPTSGDIWVRGEKVKLDWCTNTLCWLKRSQLLKTSFWGMKPSQQVVCLI